MLQERAKCRKIESIGQKDRAKARRRDNWLERKALVSTNGQRLERECNSLKMSAMGLNRDHWLQRESKV